MAKPIKQAVAEYFLSIGVLAVSFDHRRPNVIAPDDIDWDKMYVEFSYSFPVPIREMRVDEAGISGILSFSGTPREVYIPWEAVYVLSNKQGSGMTFYEDIPSRQKEQLTIKGKPLSGTHKVVSGSGTFKANPLKLIRGGLSEVKGKILDSGKFRGTDSGPESA